MGGIISERAHSVNASPIRGRNVVFSQHSVLLCNALPVIRVSPVVLIPALYFCYNPRRMSTKETSVRSPRTPSKRVVVALRMVRELQGESVYEAILRIRLEEVKHRLRHTNMPIAEIITACGWQNAISPKALFRKRFGMSMSQYRATNTIASPHLKNTL